MFLITGVIGLAMSCQQAGEQDSSVSESPLSTSYEDIYDRDSLNPLLQKYIPFTLTTDTAALTKAEKEVILKLIEAAQYMNEMFWYEAYGDKEALLNSIDDPDLRAFAKINYGPWDRLDNNAIFIQGHDPKAAGSNYYPKDMTKKEFEEAKLEGKEGLYSFIRRNDSGELTNIPYHEFFRDKNEKVAGLLREAAGLTDNAAFEKYLRLRADALLTDDYRESDMAWLDMKDNHIDVVIGPIETYEDQLFGFKAAHEAYVLVKDMDWSARLARYAQFLPDLQKGLPVPDAYKKESPGSDTELNAYDVIYYSGDCNAGSKTIAINLPNDETVQLEKGTRRLQLKNAMRAKFEKILLPISEELITPDQRKHITFDAFFSNTMFHEVAHGLGIKNTIDGSSTVRKALKEHASALEEGKADMLGLYMITQLHKSGEIKGDLMDYFVTFMTSIFRSVRFGASSAHGKANMIRFNYFDEMGAFTRDQETGHYRVNPDKLVDAMNALSELILTLQGDGNYDAVAKLVEEKGRIGEQLQSDLDRLQAKGIPVDVVFNQGPDFLNL